MNEKDKKLAHEIAWARAEDNCVNGLEDRIYAALTTVREEAREAAFRESIAILVGLPIEHYIYSGAQPMAAYTFRDNAVKAIEATIAIEAAKNQRAAANKEGAEDGR